ncbi:MAG: DUF4258 domain-containing protein [Polyangiales bacterium]
MRYTRHAEARMVELNVTHHDVRSSLITATKAARRGDAWKVTGGVDADGDDLTVVVVIDSAAVIVTVF